MHWFIQSRTHPHIQQFERDRGLKTCMPKKKPTPMQSHPKIFPTPCLQQIIPCYFLRRKYFFPPALFFKTCFPPRLKPFCPPFCFENEKILFRLKTNFFFFRKKKKKKIAPMVVGAAAVAGVTATVVGTMGGNVPNPTHHIYRGNT